MTNKEIIESNEEMRRKMEKKLKKEQITEPIKPKIPKKESKRKEEEKKELKPVEKLESDKKEKIENIKDDVEEKKEKVEEILGKKKAPAEQIINDIITGIKEKQEQFGKTLSEYTAPKEGEESKKPAVDVLETNDCITIKVDLPGVKREEIDLGITKKSLDVMATFPPESKEEKSNYIKKERIYGKVSRSITLPAKVKIKKVSAELKNSILTIKLPKVEKELHKININ